MSKYTKIPGIGVEKTADLINLTVENIKCGGCANIITKSLAELGFQNIQVDHENNLISFDDVSDDEKVLSALNKLRGLGYPLVDSEEGLTALALKAKSFTSCAIGKVSK